MSAKHFGSGGSGASGGFDPDPQSRLAMCAWCDRRLEATWSDADAAWLYPQHRNDQAVCPGARAIVPPGAFVKRQKN